MDYYFLIPALIMAATATIAGLASASIKKNIQPFERDKAKWQFDSAMQLYCESTGKSQSDLNDSDIDVIWDHACNHMSIFLTWAIMQGFCGDIHLNDEPDAVDKVKKREMTGTEFFITYCDCTLSREDFSDSILPFVDAYYNSRYLDVYGQTCMRRLHKDPLTIPFSWDDYNVFEKVLDKAYRHWKFWEKP